jgi:hypothetical protein
VKRRIPLLKGKAFILVTVLVFAVSLMAAGCGKKATITQTSTTPAATKSIDITGGGDLPVVGIDITHHGVGAGYDGICLMCHGPSGMLASQFPLPPTWNGSVNTLGTYTVTAGSTADHTGRTPDTCTTQAGCHVAKIK